MSKPPKRKTDASVLRAIHAKRSRGFKRVCAAFEPHAMRAVLTTYQPLYGKAAGKGERA